MRASNAAMIAMRYWSTYLPSQLATIPAQEREQFFADLGKQVEEAVDEVTAEFWEASIQPGDTAEQRAQGGQMAQLRAQELVLNELVYLPKEPGTEDREMPRTARS